MSDRLLALAAANNGIIASQDVHHADVDPHALAALLRAGVLRRVRRGSFVVASDWAGVTPE